LAASFGCACALALAVAGSATGGAVRIAGCTVYDFGAPGKVVTGTTARYDAAGFWSDASNGWVRQQAGPNRIAVDPGVRLLPRVHTIRLEVHPGDNLWGGERADVFYGGQTPAQLGIAEGRTQWWGWSTRTAPTYRAQTRYAKWNVLMDFHNTATAPQANIAFAVDAATNRLAFDVYAGDPHDPHWSSHGVHRLLDRFVPGKRYDFALGVHWSTDQRLGWVEVWVNGHRAVARTATATLWAGQLAYPKFANYRAPGASSWTNTVWDAGLRQASTRRTVLRCLRRR
jgi:hypothetical protein